MKVNCKSNVIRALIFLMQNCKGYAILKFCNSLITAAVPLITIWLSKYIVDGLIEPEGNFNHIIKLVILTLLIGLLNVLKNSVLSKMFYKYQAKTELELNEKILKKLNRLKFDFFDDTELYNSIERASREITSFIRVIDNVFDIMTSVLTLIFTLSSIIMINKIIVFVIILFNIPCILIQAKIRRYNFENKKELTYYKRCISGVNNMLVHKSYAGEVRVFDLFNWLFSRFEDYFKKQEKLGYSQLKKKDFYNNLIKTLNILNSGIIQIVLVYEVFKKTITVGDYTMYTSYAAKFESAVSGIVSSIMNIYEKEMFLGDLFSFLDLDDEKNRKYDAVLLPENGWNIEFENVSFKYASSNNNVLEDVSFRISNNEKIAIVGLNGAGKTTIFNLILRFYKPQSGRILLNGRNIEDYDIEEYYKHIGVVFQEPSLYPFSLSENIIFDKKEKESLIERLEWIRPMVQKYPKGLQTSIMQYFDPQGIWPSNGEVQRIALARALLKDASLLLLDEPTASMDPEVEYQLFNDLKCLGESRTCIVISHRLSVTTTADRIYVVDGGKILEQGTHSELLEKKGMYARLFFMQAEKYKDQEVKPF